jgi:hypothetical protein
LVLLLFSSLPTSKLSLPAHPHEFLALHPKVHILLQFPLSPFFLQSFRPTQQPVCTFHTFLRASFLPASSLLLSFWLASFGSSTPFMLFLIPSLPLCPQTSICEQFDATCLAAHPIKGFLSSFFSPPAFRRPPLRIS